MKANGNLLKQIQIKDNNFKVRSGVYTSELPNVVLCQYGDANTEFYAEKNVGGISMKKDSFHVGFW